MKHYPLLLALLVSGASLSALATPLSTQQAQAPGYYRMALGDWQITAVSDGTVAVPFDKLLTPITPEKLKARMAQANLPVNAETSINAFVINTGKQLIRGGCWRRAIIWRRGRSPAGEPAGGGYRSECH